MQDRTSDPDRRTLWLVRHGESTWNALGLVQGQVAVPALTPRGRAQARAAALELAGRPVRSLYTSDLRRAVASAVPVAAAFGLPAVEDERLRERGFGVAEGTPARALKAEWSGISGGRLVDVDAAPPGGESVGQLCLRIAGFLADLANDDRKGDVVLVVHGGVVRAALAHLDGVDPAGMAWGPLENGTVVSRSLTPGAPGSPSGSLVRQSVEAR